MSKKWKLIGSMYLLKIYIGSKGNKSGDLRNSLTIDVECDACTSCRTIYNQYNPIILLLYGYTAVEGVRMATARDVANYFLSLQDEEAGDTISNLKLQKLLYYAQGYHLAAFGCPLFSEKVRKWQHGPVIRELYHEFNKFGSGGIPEPESISLEAFDEEQIEFLDEIYRIFGQFSAWKLRNMTHDEAPWANASVNGVISREAMKEYFSDYVAE